MTTTTTTSTTTTTTPTICVATSGTFCDLGTGVIADSATGLQWEKKDGADSAIPGFDIPNPANLHDVDNHYSWAGCCDGDCSSLGNLCQPDSAAAATCTAHADGGTQGCSVCASGTCNVDPLSNGDITTVWDWVNQLNAANYAGHNDWRLPSENGWNTDPPTDPRELETILAAPYPCTGLANPCIDSIFGPTALPGYWSSSTYGISPTAGLGVTFYVGIVANGPKVACGYVRAVRGGS